MSLPAAGGPPADVDAFVEACEDRYFTGDVDGEIEVLEDGVLIRVMDEMAGTSDACTGCILDDIVACSSHDSIC